MVWDTSSMDLCAGKAFVCAYCKKPNPRPTKQISNPKLRIVNPPSAPPKNVILVKSGNWMFASPAKAVPAMSNNIKVLSKNVQILLFSLNIN